MESFNGQIYGFEAIDVKQKKTFSHDIWWANFYSRKCQSNVYMKTKENLLLEWWILRNRKGKCLRVNIVYINLCENPFYIFLYLKGEKV